MCVNETSFHYPVWIMILEHPSIQVEENLPYFESVGLLQIVIEFKSWIIKIASVWNSRAFASKNSTIILAYGKNTSAMDLQRFLDEQLTKAQRFLFDCFINFQILYTNCSILYPWKISRVDSVILKKYPIRIYGVMLLFLEAKHRPREWTYFADCTLTVYNNVHLNHPASSFIFKQQRQSEKQTISYKPLTLSQETSRKIGFIRGRS